MPPQNPSQYPPHGPAHSPEHNPPRTGPATQGTQTIERLALDYDDVHIELMAQGRGPLFVLLPSLGRDSEDFDIVASRIATAGYRVLRPAPRGMRGSTGPLSGITLHDLARDIAEVIRAQHAGPAVVAGHAYGNWVARATAAGHPGLVRAVILLAASHKGGTAPDASAAITRSFTTSLPDAERLDSLKFVFFAQGNDPSVWLNGWYPEIAKAQRAASGATRLETYWHGGIAPILDLQAEQDVLAPRAGANRLREELGERVSIALIHNAGHALIPEQPAAVAAAMLAYLRSL